MSDVLSQRSIYGWAMLASLLLSVWACYSNAVINTDAICYLLSAETVGESGLKSAMHLCGQAKWPFYSLLIYGFVKITHLSYLTAAYVLNSFFSLLSVCMFILIVKALGGSKRILWIAAGVILLAHEFNSVRDNIVRDHGFWAFYLTSVLFLLAYFRSPSWLAAMSWSVSLLLATLFRIEGALFLLFLPWLAFLTPQANFLARIQSFLRLNLLLGLIGLLLMGWLAWHPQQSLAQLGRVAEVANELIYALSRIIEHFAAVKVALTQHVLNKEAFRDAGFMLGWLLSIWYVIEIISNLSMGYALLVLYGWFYKVGRFPTYANLVLGAYLVINILVTLGFFLQHFFLAKRYLIALSLIFMLWVPFALDRLITERQALRQRLFLGIVSILIFISAVGGIFNFGYSKAYIQQAGNWLAQHVPNKARLYVNDNALMYYSQHFGKTLFSEIAQSSNETVLLQGAWKNYDYIALRLNKNDPHHVTTLLNEIHSNPVQVFNNKRGDRILIFKLTAEQQEQVK